MKKHTPSKLRHLPTGSCAVSSLAIARLKKNKPSETVALRRKRIRNRKKLLALQARPSGEEMLKDSFVRAMREWV